MLRSVSAIPWLALALSSAGCFGLMKKAQPDAATAADAKGEDEPACTEDGSVREYLQPLIVDMQSAARGDLEVAMKEGVVVVQHDCNTLKVLRDCRVEGSYGFMGFQAKEEVIRLDDKDELNANLPISAGGFGAKLGGELEREATLDIALMMIGKRRTTRKMVTRGDLVEDRPGACEGASHFVRGATLGAFAMTTGTKAESRGAAEIFGIPHLGKIGAGGGSKSSRDVSRKDGELSACQEADPDGESPPNGCGALLRLELTMIDDGAGTEPTPDASSPTVELCRAGMVYADGKCTEPKADQPHLCKPNDFDDCLRQCELGNAGSCGRVGYYHVIGKHFPKDPAQGAEYFEKACAQDYSVGCASLGSLYIEGEGVDRDVDKGAALVEKACNLGDARYCAFLAKVYLVGNQVDKDVNKATRFARLACFGGAADGCFPLGEAYRKGHGGVGKDEKKARKTYRMGCEGGDAVACYGYAVAIEEGIGGPKKPALAKPIFRQLCDQGLKQACKDL